MAELRFSPFQGRVLSVPESMDLCLDGGRGGAKSHLMALLALRRSEEHREAARILYVRRTYKGLADFEAITREVFGTVYGPAARYNAAEHAWRLPTGAYMELGQMDGPADYQKYQGRSFGLVMVDEAQQYADPSDVDRLRSNMRGPKGVPTRMVIAANPGGVGHHWITERLVFRGTPWRPFVEPTSGRSFVRCPSTYRDNPFIDRDEYEASLRASCPDDPELLRAWLDGDWSVLRGAFFAGVLSEARSGVDPAALGVAAGWRKFVAHDWGSAAPSVTYLVARSPGVVGFPRGSLVLLDELHTARPNRINEGMGWTVDRVADGIREMCAKWSARPAGCGDDAIFARARGHAALTIADEFAQAGVRLRPAGKGSRKRGWETVRRLMADAGSPDRPGLYVSRACDYFWRTVPYLPRDERDPEDLDSSAPDHGADAVRYACVWKPPAARVSRVRGLH